MADRKHRTIVTSERDEKKGKVVAKTTTKQVKRSDGSWATTSQTSKPVRWWQR